MHRYQRLAIVLKQTASFRLGIYRHQTVREVQSRQTTHNMDKSDLPSSCQINERRMHTFDCESKYPVSSDRSEAPGSQYPKWRFLVSRSVSRDQSYLRPSSGLLSKISDHAPFGHNASNNNNGIREALNFIRHNNTKKFNCTKTM